MINISMRLEQIKSSGDWARVKFFLALHCLAQGSWEIEMRLASSTDLNCLLRVTAHVAKKRALRVKHTSLLSFFALLSSV